MTLTPINPGGILLNPDLLYQELRKPISYKEVFKTENIFKRFIHELRVIVTS